MDLSTIARFKDARGLLKRTKINLLKKQLNITDRTNWSIELADCCVEQNVKIMAAAVIDLCYNYTNQTSIDGLGKEYWHASNFLLDFGTELSKLYKQYTVMAHKICKPCDWKIDFSSSIADWEYAVRITEEVSHGKIPFLHKWKHRLLCGQVKKIVSCAAYAGLFFGAELLYSLPETLINTWLPDFANSIGGIIFNAVFVTGTVAYISSKISATFGLQDFSDIVNCLKDVRCDISKILNNKS